MLTFDPRAWGFLNSCQELPPFPCQPSCLVEKYTKASLQADPRKTPILCPLDGVLILLPTDQVAVYRVPVSSRVPESCAGCLEPG